VKRTPIIAVAWLSAAVMVIMSSGCATASNPLAGRGVGQGAPPMTLAQRIGAAFQKTGESLAIKPRVVKAEDPLNLKNTPERITPEVYLEAAQLCEKQGNIDGAIEQCQKALAVAPDNVPTHLNLARLYSLKKDYASAAASYQQALKGNPNDVKAFLGLARLYARQEDFTSATATYQQALQVHPDSGVLLNDLGLCYARQGDVPRALQSLSRAVQADPSSKLYRNNYGTLLVEAGEPNEALQQFSAAHGPSVANYNLGLLLYKKGDAKTAVHYLQQALQLDPSLQPARALLAQLGAGGAAESYSANTAPQYGGQPQASNSPYSYRAAGGAQQNSNGGSPSYAEVRIPNMGQSAPYGESQTPPQPGQYGYQTSVSPQHLPPVR
jgi:Tfp pilus assembly protein PilF